MKKIHKPIGGISTGTDTLARGLTISVNPIIHDPKEGDITGGTKEG